MESSWVVVERQPRWRAIDFRDLWFFRELLFFFIWRDLKVQYKQTVFGAAWAILQPLLGMVIFTVFFGRMARIPSDGLPYPLFSYAGLLIWTYFSQAVSQAGTSLVGSAQLISKVYFPRLLIPTAAVLRGLVDLCVAFVFLVLLMGYYGCSPRATGLFVPLIVIVAACAAQGAGLWLAALNVQFRDVRFVIPFLIQTWLFVTPVIYPASSTVPMLAGAGLPRWILGLNPMVGVVEGFRWSLLGAPGQPGPEVLVSVGSAALFLISGAYYFRRVERSFADIV